MPAVGDLDLGVFHVNSVDRFRVTVKKDGVPWADLQGVTLVVESPDRATRQTFPMLAEDVSEGVWYYDTDPADIAETGWWTATVEVEAAGGIVKRYPHEIGFLVTSQP